MRLNRRHRPLCRESRATCVFVRYLADRLPPTSATVDLRSAIFNPGRTFNQYLSHVQKATILLIPPLSRPTPTIRAIGKGIRNAHGVSFKFHYFIRSKALVVLLERVGVGAEFPKSFSSIPVWAMRTIGDTEIGTILPRWPDRRIPPAKE